MIPNLREAKHVQSLIDKLGVQDVVLMFDKQIHMWSICQIRKKPTHILTMNSDNMAKTEALLMFWIKNNDGTYRVPNDQDVYDVIAIVQRAQVVFDKGSDWMIDKLEAQEQEQYDKNRAAQSKRIRDAAPALKKYIKKELT